MENDDRRMSLDEFLRGGSEPEENEPDEEHEEEFEDDIEEEYEDEIEEFAEEEDVSEPEFAEIPEQILPESGSTFDAVDLTMEDGDEAEEIPEEDLSAESPQPEKPKKKKKSSGEKKKMSPFVRIVLDIILVASIGLAGFSAYKLVEGYMGYHQAQEAYKNLRQTASDKDTNTDSDPGKNIDWEALQKVNVNVGAWIRAEGTTIDYPVTYAWDNEYFLKHLLDGSYNDAGTIFVDCENSQDFVDKNTVLYGHHMLEDPLMFAEIYEYTDQAFYDSHKVIEIYTPTAKYEVYPIAGFETTGTDGYIRIEFADDDDFMNYVNECRERSTFQSDVKISKEDQTVMLSTCSYVVSDGRYALLGKLVKVKDYEKSE